MGQERVLNIVEFPPTEIILRRLFLFAFMGGWSIMNSAETGPAFQVWFEFLSLFLSVQCIIKCTTLENKTVFCI